MVDEAPSLSVDVIDMIVAQFLRLDPRAASGITGKGQKNGIVVDDRQSTLELKTFPTAYKVARNICNSCSDKMAQHVAQYFSDVVVDASEAKGKNTDKRRSSDEGSDGVYQHTEEDLKELQKVHLLLRELWRACPAVLHNIIPQLEAELHLENIQLRLFATETFADMISGVGSAGLSNRSMIDPVAYPPPMLSDTPTLISINPLTKPSSPQSFPSSHPSAYDNFLNRRNDKSPLIRCAWTKGVGNIIRTSAGGTGLSTGDEEHLIADLAKTLCDADEKVRLAAVKVISSFSFHDVVNKLGSLGGISDANSFFATLADRARDKRHNVREEAMKALGSMWAAAVGELVAGNQRITLTLGGIPSKILGGYYANDPDINLAIDKVLFEQLLPLGYPPHKTKTSNKNSLESRKPNGIRPEPEIQSGVEDPDYLRAVRILLFVKSLDEKASAVFFSFIQKRQVSLSKYLEAYIQYCEKYNGGVMESEEKPTKDHLSRLISGIANQFPEPGNVNAYLWRFAKMHDRRCYRLLQYCIAPETDYKTLIRAIKEFKSRIESSASGSKDMLETLTPLLYRISILLYNKSHVPAIMAISKNDAYGLGETAHRFLLEISSNNPSVLKAHVKEICKNLQDAAPTSSTSAPAPSTILGDLKACSSFAERYADEIPKDRKFVQAMKGFALYGSPPECAKHAVSILMKSVDKKALVAHDLAACVKNFERGGSANLAQLATLSQLMLLASDEVSESSADIMDLATTLLHGGSGMKAITRTLPAADEGAAKCWAVKIVTNQVRSHSDAESLQSVAGKIYPVVWDLLRTIVADPSDDSLQAAKSSLRLTAARQLLKCCTKKQADSFLTPEMFNALALVAQDEQLSVRTRFLARLRKYLTQGKLPQRFYTIPFLLAFEPNDALRKETATWLRSRASYFSASNFRTANGKKPAIVLESTFARLLSLLAHHPDFQNTPEDLVDFSRYIAFYLSTVASSDNLSLIYHIAQRVKQSQDALGSTSDNDTLHVLSDLAQLTIRKFEDLQGFTINTLPTKIKLPTSLYDNITDHEEAQAIAKKNYLPEGEDDIEDGVERIVKEVLRKPIANRGKKRKSEGETGSTTTKKSKTSRAGSLPIRSSTASNAKRANGTSGKPAKTPKPSKKKAASSIANSDDAPSSENRRRSGRVSGIGSKSYAEDEDDDEKVDDDEIIWKYEDEDGGKGVGDGSGRAAAKTNHVVNGISDSEDELSELGGDSDHDDSGRKDLENGDPRGEDEDSMEIDERDAEEALPSQLPSAKKSSKNPPSSGRTHHHPNPPKALSVDDIPDDDDAEEEKETEDPNDPSANQLLSEAAISASSPRRHATPLQKKRDTGAEENEFDLPPSDSPRASSSSPVLSKGKAKEKGKAKGKVKTDSLKRVSAAAAAAAAVTKKSSPPSSAGRKVKGKGGIGEGGGGGGGVKANTRARRR